MLSCGTKKTTTKEYSRLDAQVIERLLLKTVRNSATIDSIHRLMNRNLHQTITYLSAPDSLGRQHPERIEENHLSETYQETGKTTTTQSDTTTVASQREADVKYEADKKEDTVSDKRLLPAWMWHVLGIIGLLLVLYIIYRIGRVFIRKR